jgi:hypothetical protein
MRLDRYAAPNENFVLVVGPHNGLRRAQRAQETLCEPAKGFANTGARERTRYQGQSPWLVIVLAILVAAATPGFAQNDARLLASKKTSTMQKEMNETADAGYRFAAVMGGNTAIGGSEVVVVMTGGAESKALFEYKLLATSKTSTMQKELQEAGDAGFEYKSQTVFDSTFGGDEVVVILERDRTVGKPTRYEYRLLSTKKTSTMQKELNEALGAGYEFVGMTVAETMVGGDEVVCILRRKVTR